MQLTKFRITNYRSVNDSGWIDVAKMTAMVGRNESGKSNVLLALESLNPPGGPQTLTLLKDFPRDRPRHEFSEDVLVVESMWTLDDGERALIDACGSARWGSRRSRCPAAIHRTASSTCFCPNPKPSRSRS